MTITVQRIQRFPIKGMSAEGLEEVELAAAQGVPGDRLFGFAREGSGFDPAAPRPLPKERFVVLVNVARLAGLRSSLDQASMMLRIEYDGEVASFDMNRPEDRAAAETLLYGKLYLNDKQAPQFVSAAPHRFTDVSVVSPQMMNAISILNLESVRDFEVRAGLPVDPARFRANIEIDGLPAWSELETMGAKFTCGDVELTVLKRTQRCAATEVNPANADRDLRVPYLLRKLLGHMDMGVYAEVSGGGRLAVGDVLTFAR